jgi:pimeloyl-ACP methyl ester carboxylesterase
MTQISYRRTGAGTPLVLLHGLGSSRGAWEPVVPALAERFDVIAVDLPGFGDSPPLPAHVEPSPAALAAHVAGLLDELGIPAPHVMGNSLGGWVALELAGLRKVAALTLLSPAGLWRGGTPLYNRISLQASRWLARHATATLSSLVNYRLGRVLVLGQTHGRPSHMHPDAAREAIRAMALSRGFDATLRATLPRHYRARGPVDCPVTVAFGDRDRLLLRYQSRCLDELPEGTQVVGLPGCGHVPMGDDPTAVAALIGVGSVSSCPY